MTLWTRSQYADHQMIRKFCGSLSHHRVSTAELLADLGEVDARRLFLAEGYPSMFQYCVRAHHMSKATANRRIDVARAARRFPAIFDALAEGRLNITAVLQLAPYLPRGNADELLAAAAHKSKSEVERLLAERFPRADLPTRVQICADAEVGDVLVAETSAAGASQLALERVGMTMAEQSAVRSARRAKVTPLSTQRVGFQFTADREAQELLVEAQALLGHAVSSGDVGEVFRRALRLYVHDLRRRRFAETSKPRKARRSANPRHIPAEVKRAVFERDGEQCTFVSAAGHRCEERAGLELDHVVPIARGGATTPDNLRVLCRAHNQHAADRVFGKGFMDEKLQEVKRQAAGLRAQKAAAALTKAQAKADADAELAAAADVIPGLRNLGASAEELRIAAARLATIPDAPFAERMICALRGLGRDNRHRVTHIVKRPVGRLPAMP